MNLVYVFGLFCQITNITKTDAVSFVTIPGGYYKVDFLPVGRETITQSGYYEHEPNIKKHKTSKRGAFKYNKLRGI